MDTPIISFWDRKIPPRHFCRFSQIFRPCAPRCACRNGMRRGFFQLFRHFPPDFLPVNPGVKTQLCHPKTIGVCKKLCISFSLPVCGIFCERCGKRELFHIFHRFFHRGFPQGFFPCLFTFCLHNFFIFLFQTLHFLFPFPFSQHQKNTPFFGT